MLSMYTLDKSRFKRFGKPMRTGKAISRLVNLKRNLST